MANPWKREKAQSLVELAIMLPILLIILLGIIDLGRVFYAAVTITNASRVGARYSSLHPLEDEAITKQRVIDEAANTITMGPENITVTSDTEAITVTVQVNFQTLFFGNLPYIRGWLPGGAFPIRARTVMPITVP